MNGSSLPMAPNRKNALNAIAIDGSLLNRHGHGNLVQRPVCQSSLPRAAPEDERTAGIAGAPVVRPRLNTPSFNRDSDGRYQAVCIRVDTDLQSPTVYSDRNCMFQGPGLSSGSYGMDYSR